MKNEGFMSLMKGAGAGRFTRDVIRAHFLLVITASITIISLLGVLPLDTARPATSEWRLQAEVDVLL